MQHTSLSMKRYEALATDIEASIRTGVLRPGDRLPSVRRTGESRGVSPSTVFQAYYLLEARGPDPGRPRPLRTTTRGGRRTRAHRCREADIASQPDGDSVALDVSEHVFGILEASMTRDVVPFGSAFPSPLLFPLPRLGQLLASSAKKLDPWSTVDDLTPGNAALRRQIALRYLGNGVNVPADGIVITNGALEALNLCLGAVTRPGDSVVVESPTFYGALQALERMGLRRDPRCRRIRARRHRAGWTRSRPKAIARHCKPKACWLMTSFQNPLGSLMPGPKKKALVELLTRNEVPLIEDDVYAELYFGDRRPAPAKAFDSEGWVLHCSSFSKSLAPGYRIGWAAPGRFTRSVARQKLTTNLNTSVPAQLALASYLERGGFDKHLRKLRQTLATQQATVAQAVGRCFPEGTRATRPLGGYFLWLELPKDVDALDLHRRALAQGISVAPGPVFSATRGFGHHLRLNYGHAWDARSERALETLGGLAGQRAKG